jgi:hypothetical protein
MKCVKPGRREARRKPDDGMLRAGDRRAPRSRGGSSARIVASVVPATSAASIARAGDGRHDAVELDPGIFQHLVHPFRLASALSESASRDSAKASAAPWVATPTYRAD